MTIALVRVEVRFEGGSACFIVGSPIWWERAVTVEPPIRGTIVGAAGEV